MATANNTKELPVSAVQQLDVFADLLSAYEALVSLAAMESQVSPVFDLASAA